ncbi:SafA/ExsA family spore coat assembly protein [Virgibacillus ihumii]|uniref:SafA/ExsA family spore coat assembly protein n=1 Tax=Virgibacillus ihumii TaxID=2686091 RepID=UPI00157C89A7
MKIHIVQKGDTLWEISKQYGADFEEVKKLNPQLSSPDMIMPGMKIKIPGTSKAVKNDNVKGAKMPEAKHPYKDTSPKPKPVMNKETEKMKPEMPMQPKMPKKPDVPTKPMQQMQMMDQDFYNYTTINFPEMPDYPQPNYQPKKNAQMHMPPQPMPMQMVPVCCYCHKPCCPPPPPMHHGPKHGQKKGGCGCGGPKPPLFRNQQSQMQPFDVPNEREMPARPKENPYINDNELYGAPPPLASTDDRYYTDLNETKMQNKPTGPNGDMPVPEPPDFGTMPAYNFREDTNEQEE